MPFLRGESVGDPHDALFWRWRSQGAVRAGHWKLILLGDQRYLFDLDSPEGETKNRAADFPEVTAGLEKRLLAWDAGLLPPHLPRRLHPQDRQFYDTNLGSNPPPHPGATLPAREPAAKE
ncbi:MAG: hypothetical protein WDM96_19850 [Lacunisphaera sp.]